MAESVEAGIPVTPATQQKAETFVDKEGFLITKDGYYLKDSDSDDEQTLTKKQKKQQKYQKRANQGLPSVKGAKFSSSDELSDDSSSDVEEGDRKPKYVVANTPN